MGNNELNNIEDTKLAVSFEKFKQILAQRIAIGEKLIEAPIENLEGLQLNNLDYEKWDEFNIEFLKISFNHAENVHIKSYLHTGKLALKKYEGLTRSTRLKGVIIEKVEFLRNISDKVDILEIQQEKLLTKSMIQKNELSSDIFIVHGHNESIKQNVARMIEKLGLNPVILHEEANVGKTVIEKFEKHADVSFAIVLLTTDDKGGAKTDSEMQPRARQNVIFEFGYFCGKLGRNRVCALYEKGVEMPSDMHGFITIPIDSAGSWKLRLVKEIKAVGFDVDANKII